MELSKAFKVTLGVLFIASLGVLVFVLSAQKGGKQSVPVVAPNTTKQSPATTDQSKAETPANTLAPAPALSGTEMEKQLRLLDEQVKAGTLSPEEARKRLDELNKPATSSTGAPSTGVKK